MSRYPAPPRRRCPSLPTASCPSPHRRTLEAAARREYTRGRNEDPCTRIRSFGYGGSYCAENIGYNAAPEGVFHSWMRSSIHRPNILDGRFHENRYRRLYGPLQRLQDYHVYYGLWCPC